MRTTLLSLFTVLITNVLQAQTPLPYNTGFDNAAQQQGWQEYRKGYDSNYSWSIAPFFASSTPNKLWHDYNVAGDPNDTIRDWYVSPPFDMSGGGTLTLKVNVFSIMGTATASDHLKIFLLHGNSDPDLATSMVELMDLTPHVTNTDTWITVASMELPTASGETYIAFSYQATTNWFTPGIDDIEVEGPGNGLRELDHGLSATRVFPVPAQGLVRIEVIDPRLQNTALQLTMLNELGQQVLERRFTGRFMLDEGLAAGLYTYRVVDPRSGAVGAGRFVLE